MHQREDDELAEHRSNKTGHILETECDLKMNVRNLVYTLSLRIGGPKTTFFELTSIFRKCTHTPKMKFL